MSDTCGRCGKQATGFATATVGGVETRYCHGDDDVSPTCYEMHAWPDEGTLSDYSPSSTMTFYLNPEGVDVVRQVMRRLGEEQQ